jgi:hypothetical protein
VPSTFLGGEEFDPKTMRIMRVAFEMARASVKRDWGGIYASHIIAKLELAKGGERNPDVLCVQALSYFLRPRQHTNEGPRSQVWAKRPGRSTTATATDSKEDCEEIRHIGVRYGTNIVRWGIATLATYGKVAIVITIIAR